MSESTPLNPMPFPPIPTGIDPDWDRYASYNLTSNPPYYRRGGIEDYDYLKARLTKEEMIGYCKASVITYLSRANIKHESPDADYAKAKWYMDKIIDLNEEK